MSTESNFKKRRNELGGKGPKVKPRGGKAKLEESKAKALIASLNALRGVQISKGVSTSTLKGVGKKIAGVIPLVGTKTKKD
tara:strand:+ start:281 stop:523 length:243 start_codon:yes stop_codon:yes gene_type:complete